jgi:DNA-binding PadR family transcriptional regulator
MTDLIILATLLPGPKHGYQLKRGASWILGQDTLHNNLVYPLLRRFTLAGWVTKKTVPGERGQTRHQYALTALGKRTLLEKLAQYEDSESRSPEGFLTRVGLFQVLDSAARENILTKRTAHLEKTQQHLAAMKERFPLDRFALETVKFLRDQTESELTWIQHLRRISN